MVTSNPTMRLALVLPAVVTLVLALTFRQGMRATDDLGYAALATSTIGGHPIPDLQAGHHAARLGAVLPLAGIFALVGASNASVAFLPLLCTVLTASLIAWLAAYFWDPAVGLAAGLVFSLTPLTINTATFYVPEPMLDFVLCAAAVLFLSASARSDRLRALMLFLAGVLVGVGYLTTEVGALMLPAFYLYLVIGKKLRASDAWLMAGFLLVFCAELAFNAAAHGNALYRFALTSGYTNDPMVQDANVDLKYRLLKSYPAAFIYPHLSFGLLGPVLVAAGVYGVAKFKEASFFVIWAALILLFYNFMTASFTHYVALPVALRLVMPACVALSALAGKMLVDFSRWAVSRSSTPLRYALIGFSTAAVAVVVAVSGLSMLLGTGASITATIARNAESTAEHLRMYPAVTFVSDRFSSRAIQFYRGFNPRDSFLPLSAVAENRVVGTPAFVVLNGAVINEARISGGLYGAGFLPSADRAALDRVQPPPHTAVFSSLFHGGYSSTLLDYAVVQELLGPYAYSQARMLQTTSPPLAQVQVFRYDRIGDRRDPVLAHASDLRASTEVDQ
jgi:4-amino-4-deoxy-L-arabinose transferase-like glycosyltransferase